MSDEIKSPIAKWLLNKMVAVNKNPTMLNNIGLFFITGVVLPIAAIEEHLLRQKEDKDSV